jgi:uncharacterized membrane protein
MNLAHIHLLLNHVPLIGLPVAMAFLGYGLWIQNSSMQKFSMFIIICLAIVVLPIFFSGEPAEELVEHLPGVAESFIESHEGAAKFSLALTLFAGFSAIVGLLFHKNYRTRLINVGVLLVSFIAVLSLAYTANLGGKIRHTELRGDATVESANKANTNTEKDEDRD